jgi:hypothetical protein
VCQPDAPEFICNIPELLDIFVHGGGRRQAIRYVWMLVRKKRTNDRFEGKAH